MELLNSPTDYFRFVNRIFKLVENTDDLKNVEIWIKPNTSFKEYLMLYYNTIETNIKTAIPFNFYRKILLTLPLFKNKNGYIYKCANCGFYMVFNPNNRITTISDMVKTPLLYGFYDRVLLNSYITYYIENCDTVNRITRKYMEINDIDLYQSASFCNYHDKYANDKCKEIMIERFNGFTDNYRPHPLLERLCIQSHTKSPITQYTNLVNIIFPNVRNDRYVPTPFDIKEIQRLSQLYLSKSGYSYNIAVIFAVFSLLVANKMLLKDKLISKLEVKRERYQFLTLREVSNIFGIHYNTITKSVPPIINTILQINEFLGN